MKVRDLKTLLSHPDEVNAGPDDTLVFAPDATYVLLVRAQGGMHQPVDGEEFLLTDQDREFLRALRIPF